MTRTLLAACVCLLILVVAPTFANLKNVATERGLRQHQHHSVVLPICKGLHNASPEVLTVLRDALQVNAARLPQLVCIGGACMLLACVHGIGMHGCVRHTWLR